ncbi:hypothetical protein BDD12DRAFT_929942 [Trichophaea hybrida]|nr:hypothetical protein BDD12DRAFT_929942 [Trichophaea hybrida]
MGKSRVVDELGKKELQFTFVFRKDGDSGYPPGDFEIGDYFNINNASLAVAAFFGALGTIGLDAVKAMIPAGKSCTANELAFQFHQEMGPRNEPSDDLNNHLDSRSPYRKQLYEKLVAKAIEICNLKMSGQVHLQRYKSTLRGSLEKNHTYRKLIVSPLKDLAKFVRSFSDNALLIIAFDEASNIPKKVLECLKRHIETFQRLPI